MKHGRLTLVAAVAFALALAAGLRQASSSSFGRVVPMSGDPVAVAVDGTTSRAFVINGADYTASVFDTTSGDLLRSIPIGHGALSVVVVEGANRVLVPNTGDDSVSVLDARTGLPLRTTSLGFSPLMAAVDSRSGRVFLTSTAGDMLAILDGRTGNTMRAIPLRQDPTALAVDSSLGRLYMVNADGTVVARDGRNGKVLFDVTAGGYPSTIAVDDQTGRVFLGDATNSSIAVLSSATGALLGRTRLPSNPQSLVVMDRLSALFVAGVPAVPGVSGISGVAVLDARTGRLLRELPLSQSPLAMIGDELHARLLLDMGSTVLSMSATGSGDAKAYPVLGSRITGEGMAVDQRTGHLFVVNTDDSNGATATSGLDVITRWIPWLSSKRHVPYSSVNEIATTG